MSKTHAGKKETSESEDGQDSKRLGRVFYIVCRDYTIANHISKIASIEDSYCEMNSSIVSKSKILI